MNADLYWPKEDPETTDIPPPPELRSGIKELTDAAFVFPAHVNPDPHEVPDQYWKEKDEPGGYWRENRDHPWVRFASALFNGEVRGMALVPREGVDAEKAWRWADACLRSFTMKHEQKLAIVAWILESNFWAYWTEDSVPSWTEVELSSDE